MIVRTMETVLYPSVQKTKGNEREAPRTEKGVCDILFIMNRVPSTKMIFQFMKVCWLVLNSWTVEALILVRVLKRNSSHQTVTLKREV